MNRCRGRAVSGAFVFLLLGVFAVFAVLLVLFGAKAYQSSVEETTRHNDERILQSIIVNAVLADDAAGAVTAERIDGMEALRIDYDYDGERYIKRLYCHDGALRELFIDEFSDFDPADGEFLCEADALTVAIEDNLITAVVTDQYGTAHTAQAALRCGA